MQLLQKKLKVTHAPQKSYSAETAAKKKQGGIGYSKRGGMADTITLAYIDNLNQNTTRPKGSSMAEMAVQGLLEFWPCKNVNKLISGCLLTLDFSAVCSSQSRVRHS